VGLGCAPVARNWASSRRSVPATFFMPLTCALSPTRDTLMPTLMAGRDVGERPAGDRGRTRRSSACTAHCGNDRTTFGWCRPGRCAPPWRKGAGIPPRRGGRVALARALDAQALVTGRASRRGKRWVVEVRIHEGATGEEVGGTRWGHTKVGPLLQRISRQSCARLGSAIEGARPAPEAAPAPAGRSDRSSSTCARSPGMRGLPAGRWTRCGPRGSSSAGGTDGNPVHVGNTPWSSNRRRCVLAREKAVSRSLCLRIAACYRT
jgi:hypothetical protein